MTTNKLDLNANFNPKGDMTRIPQCHNGAEMLGQRKKTLAKGE